jgi:hypothetical protein
LKGIKIAFFSFCILVSFPKGILFLSLKKSNGSTLRALAILSIILCGQVR